MRQFASILAVLLVLVFSTPAGAEESFEPNVVYRPNRVLVVSGTATSLISYGVTGGMGILYFALFYPFQAGFTDNDTPAAFPSWLLVPVAGPFFAAQTNLADDNPNLRPWLWGFGVAQGVGVALFASGFIFKERRVLGPPAEVSAAPSLWVGPGPRGSAGMSLGLTFD